MVEQAPHNPKIWCSNPAAARRKRNAERKTMFDFPKKTFFSNASGGGTVVDHSPRLPKVKGLILTSGAVERNPSFKKWIPMFMPLC